MGSVFSAVIQLTLGIVLFLFIEPAWASSNDNEPRIERPRVVQALSRVAGTGAVGSGGEHCQSALLSDEQIIDAVNEELQAARLGASKISERILLRLLSGRIREEVLRICRDTDGCSAADIVEITENQLAARLSRAVRTEHTIRVWAGYAIIVGAMISSAAAGGILKESLSESYKWVADYLVTPAVWLGILKLGEPLWRSLNGSFATAGYKLTTGDSGLAHLRSSEARHFDRIYDDMRNDFTEEQNRAAVLLHTALSRVEAAAGDVYDHVQRGDYVQGGARLVYTYTVLRAIFPFVPMDEPLVLEAAHVRLTRRIEDPTMRRQLFDAAMAALPPDLEQAEVARVSAALKKWLNP